MPSGHLTIGQFSFLIDRRLREIKDGWVDPGPDMISEFYSQPPARDYVERGANLTTMGLLSAFGGAHTYKGLEQAYQWQATHKEFSRAEQVERLLYVFDHFDKIGNQIKELKKSGFNTRQSHGARAFNFGFTATDSTFEFSNTEGIARFGTHTTPSDEADTSTGYVNRGTAALTWTNLKTALTNFRRFKDLAGNPWGSNHQATALVVPPELVPTADELMLTARGMSGVNSEQNIKNILEGRYKVIGWNWLTDTNNWFLINQDGWKDNNYFITSIPLETSNVTDFDHEVAKLKIYGAWTIAATNVWQNGWGAQVS